MKSNLDKFFKTDVSTETSGVWLNIADDTGFLVKRMGGANSNEVSKALAKYHKPYARQIESGAMDVDKAKEIMTKVFVHSCLVDWRGVEIDGKEAPFSKDLAIKFLNSLPELADTLIKHASDIPNYREDLGNF